MWKKHRILKNPLNKLNKKNKKLDGMAAELEKSGEDALADISFTAGIDDNYEKIKEIFKDCSDIILRRFTIGTGQTRCFIVYTDGLVKKDYINDNILKSLMSYTRTANIDVKSRQEKMVEMAGNALISIGDVKEVDSIKDAVKYTLQAHCILFIDGNNSALAINTTGWKSRQVAEPVTEAVVRGPLEGFIEDIKTNTALIRRRIKTPDLKMEKLEIGRLSKTRVVMAYVKGIADEGVVDEVRKRLCRIDIDMIIESGFIEQLIEDNPYSPFPQVGVTERPDGTAAALADGKVAILADGSPFALIVPAVFVQFLTSAEDYYVRPYFATLIRILRYIAFGIALFAPSLYIAITTYHQEMIPTPLLIRIASSHAEVPLPAIAEALLMEIIFEILREAGIRLPRTVGQAVSIVGALVIGETAVQAGLVSHVMLIVVATTGIASFALPKFNTVNSVRVLRFPMMFLGATLGIFGIIMGALFLIVHLASLRSVGVPYLSPLTPASPGSWKDLFIKFPIWFNDMRPQFIQKNNIRRMKSRLMPKPPAHGDNREGEN